MKKLLSLLMSVILLLSLAACGGTTDTENKEGPVQVDEGLLTVDVTIGANFFEDTTEEEIKANAKEKGFLSCTVNEDGSVSYKMTKIKHREMLNEFKASLDETIDGFLNGEEKVASFVSIDYNDDFSKIDIFVDAKTYSTWDNLYALTFYISGAYYQSFAGVPADEIDVVVHFMDNETNEVLNTTSYKEFLKNAEASATEDDT